MNLLLNLKDVTPEKVRCKVAALKTTYVQALNWRGKTGQGVMEDQGKEAVKGKDSIK